MTQRFLRTVPAAIVMTTAMAWNLPVAAQGSAGGGMPPATTTAPSKAPNDATPPGGTSGAMLPRPVTPAMPASATAPAQRGAATTADFGPNDQDDKPTKPKSSASPQPQR